jgi:Glycosyl transferase family 90
MSQQYKYQIDLGGVSGTAWNGLRWKMCASGGLVFRVETFAMDWWHDELRPWQHYVPVRSDLRDLRERYDWAETHPQLAYDIVRAGRDVCLRSYTRAASARGARTVVHALRPLPYAVNKTHLGEIFQQFS